MKDQNLLALVTQASKNASVDAFIEICNLKAREVIFLCSRQMGNPHDGEDAAQEVFIRMQKSILRLQAPEAFNVWLNRLIHTTCANMKRDAMKHSNAVPIDSLDDSLLDDSEIALPQEYAENADKRQRLATLIDDLPEKYRTCILLHYYQHLSYAQIAEVLGLPQDTVNNNMRMARKVLKLELENEMAHSQPGGSKMWSMAGMVALGPVLTTSLQEAARFSISPATIGQCLAAVGIPTLLAAGAGGVAGGAGLVGQVAGASTGKMLVQIAATAALVLGGGLGLMALNQGVPASTPTVQASQALPLPGQQATVPLGAPLLSGCVYLAGEGLGNPATNGFSGAQLQLVAEHNPSRILETATTGPDGRYAFTALPSGSYRLLLVLPAGATGVENETTLVDASPAMAGQAAGVVVQGQRAISLSTSSPLSDINIALSIPTRLQGDILLQENGRPMAYNHQLMAGASMQLLDAEENLVATTSIDENGHYLFDNLPIAQRGLYSLHILTGGGSGAPLSTEITEVELYPGFRN